MATGEKTALKRVEDSILEDLECSICFEIRPLKILPCSYGHSFCAHCINNIEGKRRCPLCRQSVTLPKGGAQGLPDDVNKEDLNDLLLWVRDHMNVDCVLCGFEGNAVAHKLYKYCQNERIPLCEVCQRRFKRKSTHANTVFRSSTLRTVRNRSDANFSTLGRVKSRLMRRITNQDYSGSMSPKVRRKRSTSASRVSDRPVSAEQIELQKPLIAHELSREREPTSRENVPKKSSTIDRPRPSAPPLSPSATAGTAEVPSQLNRSRHGSAHSFCELIANLYSQWSTGSFERANGVVFLPRDHVIVSDWYGEKLYKYDVNTGAVVKSRSLRGSFSCLDRESGHGPWSIVHYQPTNKLLISETGSRSLRVVSPDNLESQKKRLLLDGVQQPVGLGCLRNGHVVVTEANYGGRHHVRIHDVNSGMCLRQWDCSGRSGSPLYMTVDHRDRIIVSEHTNSCVKIFDSTGRTIGRYGDANILHKPSGVAVDHMGRILVIHETPRGHQVAVLSSDGSRQVDTLAQSDRSLMNLTDTHMWDLKNIAVHRSLVALVGKEGIHMCKFGSFY